MKQVLRQYIAATQEYGSVKIYHQELQEEPRSDQSDLQNVPQRSFVFRRPETARNHEKIKGTTYAYIIRILFQFVAFRAAEAVAPSQIGNLLPLHLRRNVELNAMHSNRKQGPERR